MGGADIGVKDVIDRVTNQSKECPKQKFALVGYSQGGGVVSSAAPKIPQELRSRVVALVLYGAGKNNAYRVNPQPVSYPRCISGGLFEKILCVFSSRLV
jgi:pimeloyl-ACP methyl ester carboxylesterase